jgi:cytoskeletal protein CcmA (bactofilin family)
MWKKDDEPEHAVQPVRPAGAAPRPDPPSRAPAGPTERATIGPSITIRGDVTGDEDLVIQGRVEGTVDLKQHSVTVGPEGRVKADISGRDVTVEGEVTGNVRAQDHAILRATARVDGDLAAPRVVIEEGAAFRGRIDMTEPAEKAHGPKPVAAPALGQALGGGASTGLLGEAKGPVKS